MDRWLYSTCFRFMNKASAVDYKWHLGCLGSVWPCLPGQWSSVNAFQDKTCSALISFCFWRQKPEPAPIKSRPQGQQRWKVEWINNLVGGIHLQLYCDNLVNMKAWWRLQATFRADLAAIAIARRNAERLSRRQSHCDAAACLIDWLSNWSSATTPIDKGRKRARCALIIRWFTIVSVFLFLVWFMLVGVSVVSAEASITECGCAQSCSPLQAGGCCDTMMNIGQCEQQAMWAALSWSTTNNLDNRNNTQPPPHI